jgi:hypothetical protein
MTKDEQPTLNSRPADRGDAVLTCHTVATISDHEDALADLLADLMHLARRDGFDFKSELVRARGHYEAELIEEGADPFPKAGRRMCRPRVAPTKRFRVTGIEWLSHWPLLSNARREPPSAAAVDAAARS